MRSNCASFERTLKMKVTKPNSIWTEFKINFKRGWNDGVELWVYALRRYLKFEI